jgi:hypothetical protein
MAGVYSEALVYFLVACVCVLPGILAALFGRGPFMVAAASFSALALLSIFFVTCCTYAFFTRGFGPMTTASFWLGLMVPVALSGFCARIAIIEERRQ